MYIYITYIHTYRYLFFSIILGNSFIRDQFSHDIFMIHVIIHLFKAYLIFKFLTYGHIYILLPLKPEKNTA